MANNNDEPRSVDPQVDNTPDWLKEVKTDAEFNYKRLLREQQEKAAHEEAKAAQKNK